MTDPKNQTDGDRSDWQRIRQELEADKWFYDLGKLAAVVEANELRSRLALRRLRVIAGFAVFVAVTLGLVMEVQQHQMSDDARVSCMHDQLVVVRLNATLTTDLLPVPRC